MPLKLLPAADADFDRITECMFSAFIATNDPFLDVVFPGRDTESGRATVRDRMLKEYHDNSFTTFLKVVDEEDLANGTQDVTRNEQGKPVETEGLIISAGKWLIYETDEDAVQAAEEKVVVDWHKESPDDKAHAEFVMGEIHHKRAERTAGKRHCFLDILFTHPDHQQRGAGKQIVQWGCAKADAMNMQAFIVSSPYGRHLYEQNGFVVEEEYTISTREKWPAKPEVPVCWMRRPAQTER